MKITKRQLRRIIKEEKAKLTKEALDPVLDAGIVTMVKDELMEYALNMALAGDTDVFANLKQASRLSSDDLVQAIVVIARDGHGNPGLIVQFEEDNMGLY